MNYDSQTKRNVIINTFILKKNVEINNILAYDQLNTFIDVTSFMKTMLNF